MLTNLEKQKFTLEAAEDTSTVFETLSLATATTNEYLKQHGSDSGSLADDLKSELAQ